MGGEGVVCEGYCEDGRQWSGDFFWSDPWLGGVPLSVRYRRLFDLSLNRFSTVEVMRDLGCGDGGAAWSWRRQLWAWEEELLEEYVALYFMTLSCSLTSQISGCGGPTQ
ncbi:DNA-directed RNA polymerase, partial [Trifolium medium]|nr:DNA-directed RNA polymerase [Trifolium medium]